MLNIDEPRKQPGFALFRLGFRPFFLGGGLFAVIAMLLWMAAYVFAWQPRPYGLSALSWHAHEMVYGYAMAVIAGFLLTAIGNWTGRKTLHGMPLFVLTMLWLAARLLPFLQEQVSLLWVLLADGLFMVGFIIAAAWPIVQVRQWNHLGILAILVMLLVANLYFYAGLLGWVEDGLRIGIYAGLYLVLALIFLMARRVMPFFIEKGVDQSVMLVNYKWIDLLNLPLFLLFLVVDVLLQDADGASVLAATLFVMHVVRLRGWYTAGIWRKPLLWVLYGAYIFIVLAFLLKALQPLLDLSAFLALHAFAVGGIGVMTLGMMARVSLGHTGRNVFEPPAVLSWLFLVLLASALVRVFLPLLVPALYIQWVVVSQLLWICAFAAFLFVYLPMLVSPRIDGKDG